MPTQISHRRSTRRCSGNVLPGFYNAILGGCRPLFDMDERFRIMDKYPDVVQVLTVGPVPSLESFADPTRSVDLARMANDEMAEAVSHTPGQVRRRHSPAPHEQPRGCREGGGKGDQRSALQGHIRAQQHQRETPQTPEEFLPLDEMMNEYNLPIYIHPWRSDDFADYPDRGQVEEDDCILDSAGPTRRRSAMTRLVFSGILGIYPNLKVITHHCGGMVPHDYRIHQHYSKDG